MTGIVIRKDLPGARNQAARLKIAVEISSSWKLPWEKTLFVGGEYGIPWDLLPAGFRFLERWDAAAPLWRQGLLASDVGTNEERKQTEQITLDLRIPLYEPDLLFVRNSDGGRSLVERWQSECQPGMNGKLAFLRALHLVKPCFCVLPTTWLAKVRSQGNQFNPRMHAASQKRDAKMVRLEISPGRFVKVLPGTEKEVMQRFRNQLKGR